MKKTKEKIGTISGKTLMTGSSGKANRNDGVVKSGTGYHKSQRDYNRKSKTNQHLKNKLKNYGSEGAFLLF